MTGLDTSSISSFRWVDRHFEKEFGVTSTFEQAIRDLRLASLKGLLAMKVDRVGWLYRYAQRRSDADGAGTTQGSRQQAARLPRALRSAR